jgi:demethylmenaquinone methyltransferase/2-methoxy-6-polyprenyl-1,4-benzoquinol methylase
MSTFVVMKIFEKFPRFYGRGIQLISRGKVDKGYDRLTSVIQSGYRVLDIGCGTGALCLRAARRGAVVKAIDIDPDMLQIARRQAESENLSERISFDEMAVAELGNEPSGSYDVVMSGLCFSELSDDELNFTVEQCYRLLKPKGKLLVADEIRPSHPVRRLLSGLVRFLLLLVTVVIAGQRTRALRRFPEKVRSFGFSVESCRLNRGQTFLELVAAKKEHP